MLKETYLAIMNKIPKDAVPMVVTRTAGSILAPSWELLNDYKANRITWEQYTKRFYMEMDNELCRTEMRKIKEISKNKDIYLICYEKPPKNCHRYLLIDMINKL